MKLKYLSAALLAMAIAPIQATAATSTATLNVTLNNVAPAATVTTSAVAFGDVLTTASTATGQGSITVNVTNSIPYTVELDAGTRRRSAGYCREMSSTASSGAVNATRAYGLYSDSGLTAAWGDSDGANSCSGTTNNGGAKVSGTGNGADQILTVYAFVGAHLTGPATALSDAVTVTVTF